jgi:putative colanic acid biosynthesis acetyltransferase WcaF
MIERGSVKLRLSEGTKWSYPFREYILRILWVIMRKTIWKLLPRRIWFLRSILLRAFRAKCSLRVGLFGNTVIEMPWKIKIGIDTSIGPRVNIYNLGYVTIGNNVVISQDVYLCGGTHDYKDPTMPLIKSNIIIEDYVWVGAGAFIGPNVRIGEGAVVGARTVVVKDVEPWTVVAGNPAKMIKKRDMKYI